MRAISIISLTFFYMAFNAGVLIHYHFCGDTFHHLTIIAEPADCCGDDNNCCHNSSYTLSIDDDYDRLIYNSQNIPVSAECLITPFREPLLNFFYEDQSLLLSGPLILRSKQPIYLTHRVFRI